MGEFVIQAEHYRQRAKEVRALAEPMKDPETKSILRKVAKDYENMADQIERMSLYSGTGSANGET